MDMASPTGPSRREVQLLADRHEQWQVQRYILESRHPLRSQLAEILCEGIRAGEIRARLELTLQLMSSSHGPGA
jgi:hypothetical protein